MPLTKTEADRIVGVIQSLIATDGKAAKTPAVRQPLDARAHAGDGEGAQRELVEPAKRTTPAVFEEVDKEAMYQQFKARLLEELPVDPILLHVVMTRPEIRLSVERKEVPIEGKSLKGRIAALMGAGFLDEPKLQAHINRELDRTGGSVNSGNLGRALADFRVDGLLTFEADGWKRAPGIEVHVDRLVRS